MGISLFEKGRRRSYQQWWYIQWKALRWWSMGIWVVAGFERRLCHGGTPGPDVGKGGVGMWDCVERWVWIGHVEERTRVVMLCG